MRSGKSSSFAALMSSYCSVLKQMGKKPLLHPTSARIRAGSWQETVLIGTSEEKRHIKEQKSHMTDAEEENCQSDSKGLEENHTADKLLDFLPNESQIWCKINNLTVSC